MGNTSETAVLAPKILGGGIVISFTFIFILLHSAHFVSSGIHSSVRLTLTLYTKSVWFDSRAKQKLKNKNWFFKSTLNIVRKMSRYINT